MRYQKGTKKTVVLLLMAALLLGGCEAGTGLPRGENTDQQETMDYDFLEDTQQAWEDNRLDDMRAVLNFPVVKQEKLEGESSGGRRWFVLGEGGCAQFDNHLNSDYRKSWSGVNGITPEGEEFFTRLEINSGRAGVKVSISGPISGKVGYAGCKELYVNGEVTGLLLYELDEDFREKRSVEARLSSYGEVTSIVGDAEGNFHLTHREGALGSKYVVVSPEGTPLFETERNYQTELRSFGEGRVALCGSEMGGWPREKGEDQYRFFEADLETGTLRELSFSKKETFLEKLQAGPLYATPVDDYRLAWCGKNGIYLGDSRSGETKVVYGWYNHGIFLRSIWNMAVMEDGRLQVLYDDMQGNVSYLLLEPTGEKEELQTITLAVSPYHKDRYTKAAALFNKRYPAYHLEVRDDYEETGLLTQLGAGEGPVLVDTELTGFEELENLWQPLDGFLEAAGISGELLPNTQSLGKIGETTYGIVTEFTIQTLVVSDPELTDWDYEGFLDALEKRGSAAAFTYRYDTVPTDRREFFFELLSNGLEDNYYLDREGGSTIFGTPEFDRVLKLSDRARECPAWEEGKALQEGRAVAEVNTILVNVEVFRLRRRLEKDGQRALGYPTKEGARHLLVAVSPIALRSTATEEEKKTAYTFLKLLLSHEVMSSMGGASLPVRRDVLEDQLKVYEETVEEMKKEGTHDPNFMPELEEADREFLEELLENAVPKRLFPAALQNILDEELGAYMGGGIDGKLLSEHLRSRAGLYLDENE